MTETRYCIICGEPFESDDPEAIFCPAHGGKAPGNSGQETKLDVDPQPTVRKPFGAGKIRLDDKGTLDDYPETPQDFEPPSQDLADWPVGKVILDTYEVKGTLGKGGFGKVYRAHHRGWNMDLAIKRALKLDEEDKQDFIDEAQHWIDLGLHPHIISCFYVRNIDGFPHTFAELAEGGSLHDWIGEEQGNLYQGSDQEVLARILDLAIQFAWGLGYAHEQGLVHQDVKPQNALMTPEGVLKVTDFGLAKAKGTTGTTILGEEGADLLVSGGGFTPAYCSPEQAGGQKLSLKTDIWSWGVSVMEMFTGGISWMGGQVAAYALESYLQHAGDEDDIPSMPIAVAVLLRDCFQEEPQARPKDMLAIAEQLLAVYQQETREAYPRERPESANLLADSLNNKAISLLDLGKTDQVEACWQAALQADSFHLQATYNYGVWQWRQAHLTDEVLLEQLERAGTVKHKSVTPLYLRSLVHLERGDKVRSEILFNQVKEISPEEYDLSDLVNLFNERKGSACLYNLKTGPVTSMAVSKDGKTLVTACQGSRIEVWDLITKTCKDKSIEFNDAELPVVAVSSNGNLIVEGGYRSLQIWDRKEGKSRKFNEIFDSTPRSLAISPNNEELVCGCDDGYVFLFDLRTQDLIDELQPHLAEARAVIFSPNGKLIISGGDYGKIFVSCKEDMRTLAEFEGPEVWALTTTRNGEEIFAACRDGNIYHWNLKEKTLKKKLIGHQEEVCSVAISPDGDLLISGSHDATVRIWDSRSGRCLFTANDHERNVTGVWLQKKTPSGYCAVTGSNGDGVRLWQFTDNYPPICQPQLSRPSSSQKVISLANKVDEVKQKIRGSLKESNLVQARDLLITARKTPGFENDDELLELSYEICSRLGRYDRFLGARKLKPITDHVDITSQLAVTPDERFLLSTSHRIYVWDLKTRSYLRSFSHDSRTPFVVLPSGQCITISQSAMLTNNSDVKICDPATGQMSQSLHHEGYVADVKFDKHSKYIFTLENKQDRDHSVINIWQLNENHKIFTIPCKQQFNKIQITNNGKFILTYQNNGFIGIISLGEHPLKHRLTEIRGSGICSPNSTQAAAFSGKGMVLFDLETGEKQRVFDDIRTEINRLTRHAFSHDGQYIFSPYKRNIGMWSVKSGSLETVLEIPEWHRGIGITCLQMGSNDGWVFAAGNPDFNRGEIALWQVKSSKPVHVFKDFGNIYSMALIDQDRYLIAPRKDQFCIWQLDWGHEFPELLDWDEAANGYLEVFLGQMGGKVSWHKLQKSEPNKAEQHLSSLMDELRQRGYGWLREEGVRRKLEEMARERG